jgi:adenylylsulfate kinase-like enzyme
MMATVRHFLVLSGLPGSGKTSLGRSLARALDLPLLDKDEILDGLFDSLGTGDADWRSRLSRAADEVLRRLAFESSGAVLVSFWKHPRSTSASGTPTSWLKALPGPVVEVHCACKPETATQRFLARQRHAGHLDHLKQPNEILKSFIQMEDLGHLGVGELIRVDTGAAVDVEAVVRRLKESGYA